MNFIEVRQHTHNQLPFRRISFSLSPQDGKAKHKRSFEAHCMWMGKSEGIGGGEGNLPEVEQTWLCNVMEVVMYDSGTEYPGPVKTDVVHFAMLYASAPLDSPGTLLESLQHEMDEAIMFEEMDDRNMI